MEMASRRGKSANNTKAHATKKAGDNRWIDAIPEKDQGPSFAVEIDEDAAVWMGTWNSVYRFKNDKLEKMVGPESPVSALCKSREGIYVAGPRGVWLYSNNEWTKKEYHIARSVRDVTSDHHGGLWAGSRHRGVSVGRRAHLGFRP